MQDYLTCGQQVNIIALRKDLSTEALNSLGCIIIISSAKGFELCWLAWFFLFCYGTQGLFEVICPQESLSIPCGFRFSKANLILFVLCKLEGSVVHSVFTGGERLTNGTHSTACITNITPLHILCSTLWCSAYIMLLYTILIHLENLLSTGEIILLNHINIM